MSELLQIYGDMIWRDLSKERRGIFNAIAETASEKGLPVSYEVHPQYVTVIAPFHVVHKFKLIEAEEEVHEIHSAEMGSSLGRPKLNFPTWTPDFKHKVEAEWWAARGNKKRAKKVLGGLEPLNMEDKKRFLEKFFDSPAIS